MPVNIFAGSPAKTPATPVATEKQWAQYRELLRKPETDATTAAAIKLAGEMGLIAPVERERGWSADDFQRAQAKRAACRVRSDRAILANYDAGRSITESQLTKLAEQIQAARRSGNHYAVSDAEAASLRALLARSDADRLKDQHPELCGA